MRVFPALPGAPVVSLFALFLIGTAIAGAQQIPPPPPDEQQAPYNAPGNKPSPYPAPPPAPYDPSPGQQAPYPPPPTADALNWVPQGMTALAQQASWHTDFTFDRSMLALAGNLTGLDEPGRVSLGRLNGVSVHSYRFPSPGSYDPRILDAVRAQYAALGWKHIAGASRPGDLGYAAGSTDFWVSTQGINVAGGAILMAGPSSVNLIAISGDLSTLDLLHLRGHFGIPRFPDNALPH